MTPRTNFQLARIFGIRVGVGFSWFVVLFVFIIFLTPIFHTQLGGSRTTAYLVGVASVLSFFSSSAYPPTPRLRLCCCLFLRLCCCLFSKHPTKQNKMRHLQINP